MRKYVPPPPKHDSHPTITCSIELRAKNEIHRYDKENKPATLLEERPY